MSTFVLLTDDNNDTLLVRCEDIAVARDVASAAVFSDGGVSAWMLDEDAVEASEDLANRLRAGESCNDFYDLPRVAVSIEAAQ